MLNCVKILFNALKVQASAEEELAKLVRRPDKHFSKVYYIFT